jgi:FG-GAP-like repeat
MGDKRTTLAAVLAIACVCAAALRAQPGSLARMPTDARAAGGDFIAWREHLIDDEATGGVPLRGGDGLVMADLDGDGYEDIVSVHESDDVYDGAPEGHIRIAFGSADPDVWQLATLAEGPEAGAAEDVAVADLNGDGLLDIVAACELAHLIYFENPGRGPDLRRGTWARLIPTATQGRGSFIRVFLADLNGDGRPEVLTANKGAQDPTRAAQEPKAISFFELAGSPLDDAAWVEHVLTEVPWPINAEPVDLDGDGDSDVLGGSVAEERIIWFENVGRGGAFDFAERDIVIAEPGARTAPLVNGFNMDFDDLNGDGRLDIVTFDTARLIGLTPVWLEQPAAHDGVWRLHRIGTYAPDSLVGFVLADIDSDGDPDLMTGGYSLGSRLADGQASIDGALGRLAWFQNPGRSGAEWQRHDFSRRERGMYDKFVPRDLDGDGDVDFVTTRGNSGPYDGVLWLEQVRSREARQAFTPARAKDSPELPLP